MLFKDRYPEIQSQHEAAQEDWDRNVGDRKYRMKRHISATSVPFSDGEFTENFSPRFLEYLFTL